jgi:hypothetical protein
MPHRDRLLSGSTVPIEAFSKHRNCSLRGEEEQDMPVAVGPEKITFGEMRSSGVRGVLIYCRIFKPSEVNRIMCGGSDSIAATLSI